LAENPVLTLARLLGGVVLMQGRLGHQVLGQLLVMNTNEVAIAGAAVVVAASSNTRNAVAQVALRTAAPALAARVLIHKDEKRLERRAALVIERERRFDMRARAIEERDRAVQGREREFEARRSASDAGGGARVQPRHSGLENPATITALEEENRRLQRRVVRLSTRLRSRKGRK
jgi:hypothetical protein